MHNEYSGLICKKGNTLSILTFLRDYLFSVIGIFFIFSHNYICSQKKVTVFFNLENLYVHATTIPFSNFSFLNTIFLKIDEKFKWKKRNISNWIISLSNIFIQSKHIEFMSSPNVNIACSVFETQILITLH